MMFGEGLFEGDDCSHGAVLNVFQLIVGICWYNVIYFQARSGLMIAMIFLAAMSLKV